MYKFPINESCSQNLDDFHAEIFAKKYNVKYSIFILYYF